MPARIVIGAQFGDEGKGKVVDFFAENSDLVARFNGGNNAGHTVVVGDETFKFHLMPSGAVQGKECCIGAGLVVDPKVLLEEIKMIEDSNRRVKLFIDGRAHIIMPWHKQLDGVKEKQKGKSKIGTTKKGIGPCYADRASRNGIRFCEFVERKRFERRVKELSELKIKTLKKIYGIKPEFTVKKVIKEYSEYALKLKEHLSDCSLKINRAFNENKQVLIEGAQGTFLDNDFGTYPYVTSSHPLSGGALIGAGFGLNRVNACTGVVKAYSTRVGSGPFVTELKGELAEKIREKGNEYGTTTGRPRRVGWIDLPMLRRAHMLNNFTDFALTKLDILSGLKKVKACVSYSLNGEKIMEMPYDTPKLSKCKPNYKEFNGFDLPEKINSLNELPSEALEYIKFIETQTTVPIKIISYGPKRSQTLSLF